MQNSFSAGVDKQYLETCLLLLQYMSAVGRVENAQDNRNGRKRKMTRVMTH